MMSGEVSITVVKFLFDISAFKGDNSSKFIIFSSRGFGGSSMKEVWSPISLHRLKPLILMLLGSLLLFVSKHIILTVLAMAIMLYAAWILHVRFVLKEDEPVER